ncbi:MAG TPA: tetratricopeptide repeat protein [Pyrinomonadaceae bacterium]|nr:tetratricopeptide repeat protein [Pyrinomonadaceae bacterium]
MTLTDNLRRQLDNPNLTTNERALIRCRAAADLIHSGQYEKAGEALSELWRGVGVRPNVEGLEETTAAEVLLQAGALSGWIGASKRVAGAQDAAKDLLSEARRLFEAHGLQARVAEAGHELSVCYWRAGAFDEARVILQEAARRLSEKDFEQKAKIFIRSTVVEISAGRYHDALKILDEAESVIGFASDALKGRWHGQRGVVLRRLSATEGRADYLDRAIIEYTAASIHFERAQHERYRGNAENNLAFLLFRLSRYKEAHEHLDRAQMIFTKLKDHGNLAQVDETRARVLIEEGKYREAIRISAGVTQTLEQIGEQALLADALIVQATAEARLGRHAPSLQTFDRAVTVAEQAGALESAGLATLAMIEEHGATRLSEEELYEAFTRAEVLLRRTQDAEAVSRLLASTRLIARRLGVLSVGGGFDLAEALRRYEARFIRYALRESGGRVTQAAKRLGITYQKLQYLLETRHRDLAPERMPAEKRLRSIVKKDV